MSVRKHFMFVQSAHPYWFETRPSSAWNKHQSITPVFLSNTYTKSRRDHYPPTPPYILKPNATSVWAGICDLECLSEIAHELNLS